METAVRLAGWGQLGLALASLVIPRVLGWREETRRLSTLTRRVFWTYAVYVFGTNVALGVVSVVYARALAEGGGLARAVCVYAAVYWGGRVGVQFTAFRGLGPKGAWFRVAEVALVALFVSLTGVYASLAL